MLFKAAERSSDLSFSQMAISDSYVFIADSRIRCGIRPWKLGEREGKMVVLLCAFSSLQPTASENRERLLRAQQLNYSKVEDWAAAESIQGKGSPLVW